MSLVPELYANQPVQEMTSRPPATDTATFETALVTKHSPEHFTLSLTPHNLLRLLHLAREARRQAVSYRHFRVGASALALGRRPAHFAMVSGANIKPEKDSTINIHAEQSALQKVGDNGLDTISMMAIVSDTQRDQQSGKEMVTLHPCGICRGAMEASPHVHNETLVIASALPSLRTIELYDLPSLMHYHQDDHKEGATQETPLITRFDFPDLELLRPATAPTDGATAAPHDPIRQGDEMAIWNETVGPYLAQKRRILQQSPGPQ